LARVLVSQSSEILKLTFCCAEFLKNEHFDFVFVIHIRKGKIKKMDDKENKCQKYEQLFIFGDEEKLEEHLKECPHCRELHEKMQKVSALVKEAKPAFKKERKKTLAIRTVCASMLLVFTFFGIGLFGNIADKGMITASNYDDIYYESVIDDWGFPVDEYGLLLVGM